MKKFILALMLVVGLASLAQAAVVLYEEGTKLGTVEKVNLVGGSITGTVAGNTGTITATATPTITGGTINGAVIGGTSPAAGTFTTLDVTTSVSMDGTNINWADVTLAGTHINWGAAEFDSFPGINWDSFFDAATAAGVNWQAGTGL